MQIHHYTTHLEWTGNLGTGTSSYRNYKRDHILHVVGKQLQIPGSSDPSFRGDPSRYNPEELLVSSLSACHMLWFLHLCATNNIVVTRYVDQATGTMMENEDGSGQFKTVTLHPEVTVKEESMIEKSLSLHHQANRMCFIANSCNFPVNHQPTTKVQPPAGY